MSDTERNRTHFNFIEMHSGSSHDVIDSLSGKTPYEFFRHFLNNEVLQLIVSETNKYAEQQICKGISPHPHLQDWEQTNVEEIEQFFGILMWMGLGTFPHINSYWSTSKLYFNEMRNVMSRNRFQMLLKHIHFSDNIVPDTNDRLCKITPLLELVKQVYKSTLVPDEAVCIDETLVPFRGRVKFRQYIPNKRHKFGMKLFKICVQGGYTNDFRVYCGNDKGEQSVAT